MPTVRCATPADLGIFLTDPDHAAGLVEDVRDLGVRRSGRR
ncbi:hypothetical protein [Corynebacterium sp. MC3]|nr:hypothetical protein [Corynebacterium sp. MC3]